MSKTINPNPGDRVEVRYCGEYGTDEHGAYVRPDGDVYRYGLPRGATVSTEAAPSTTDEDLREQIRQAVLDVCGNDPVHAGLDTDAAGVAGAVMDVVGPVLAELRAELDRISGGWDARPTEEADRD